MRIEVDSLYMILMIHDFIDIEISLLLMMGLIKSYIPPGQTHTCETYQPTK